MPLIMNIEKVNYEIMFKFRIRRYMENIHTNYEFDRIHKVLKKLNCSLAAFIGSLQLVRHSLASLVFFLETRIVYKATSIGEGWK